MKSIKTSIAILFAAVLMLLMMAVPSFAEMGSGYYEVGSPVQYNTTDTIKVKLVIESREFSQTDSEVINTPINNTMDITLTGSPTYTVLDVLRKYNQTNNDNIEIQNTSGNVLTTTDTFISAITKIKPDPQPDKAYSYLFFEDIGNGEGRMPVDGWMFRVNGKYPMLSLTGFNGGPEGALIHQVPVANGDVVSLYTNCPFKIGNTNFSTAYVGADIVTTNTECYIQLRNCKENHYDLSTNPVGQWTFALSKCTNYSDNTRQGTIYDANWNVKATLNFSMNGKATWPSNLGSGTYYLYVPSTQLWFSRTAYAWFTGSNTVTCNVLRGTRVFDRIVKN